MKKITQALAIILSFVLALSIIGCGENNESSVAESSAITSSTSLSSATNESSENGESSETYKVEATGLWTDATYRNDMTFGEGQKEIKVEVKAEDKSVTFTVKTDKATLGEALIDHELVSGEQGAYGLYIKVVNGMTADYDIDQSYWSLYQDGEYAMSGADTTEISGGEHFELVYTK